MMIRSLLRVIVVFTVGLPLVLGAAAQSATYSGVPYYCLNIVTCGFKISPSGLVWVNAQPPSLPSPGSVNTFLPGHGLFLLPSDHQITNFYPNCLPAYTPCSPGAWSGQVAFSGAGANSATVYEVTGSFSAVDLAPGLNLGHMITATVDMFLACRTRFGCEPRTTAPGPGTISITVQ